MAMENAKTSIMKKYVATPTSFSLEVAVLNVEVIETLLVIVRFAKGQERSKTTDPGLPHSTVARFRVTFLYKKFLWCKKIPPMLGGVRGILSLFLSHRVFF